MSESSIRALLIACLFLACVAGMALTASDDARKYLIGAAVILLPAVIDSTRVAERDRRHSLPPPRQPSKREDTARTRRERTRT